MGNDQEEQGWLRAAVEAEVQDCQKDSDLDGQLEVGPDPKVPGDCYGEEEGDQAGVFLRDFHLLEDHLQFQAHFVLPRAWSWEEEWE